MVVELVSRATLNIVIQQALESSILEGNKKQLKVEFSQIKMQGTLKDNYN